MAVMLRQRGAEISHLNKLLNFSHVQGSEAIQFLQPTGRKNMVDCLEGVDHVIEPLKTLALKQFPFGRGPVRATNWGQNQPCALLTKRVATGVWDDPMSSFG